MDDLCRFSCRFGRGVLFFQQPLLVLLFQMGKLALGVGKLSLHFPRRHSQFTHNPAAQGEEVLLFGKLPGGIATGRAQFGEQAFQIGPGLSDPEDECRCPVQVLRGLLSRFATGEDQLQRGQIMSGVGRLGLMPQRLFVRRERPGAIRMELTHNRPVAGFGAWCGPRVLNRDMISS